jgi:predicted lipid carrier protein YhbT
MSPFVATCQRLSRSAHQEEDPDTLFFQRRLVIEGDTELGLQVKNLMFATQTCRRWPVNWRVAATAYFRQLEKA